MRTELPDPHRAAPPAPLDLVADPAARVLFWRPAYPAGSEALRHVPYLFWLLDVARPRALVQLGLGDGVIYFALCQAVDRLDLDARCHGIDPRIRPGVARHEAERVREISRLAVEDPGRAAARFEAESVDLLVIEATALAAGTDLAALLGDWRPRLSRRGVVVVHGRVAEARALLGDGAAAFDAGAGLLTACGADADPRLHRLGALRLGDEGFAHAHQIFERLGTMAHAEWESRAARARIERLEAEARAGEALAEATARHDAEVALLTAELAALREDQIALRAALKNRDAAAGAAEAGLAHAERRLAESEALRREILGSTMWRITAPARRVLNWTRR